MGYGKAWESMYDGSMFGKSMAVMAVWNYCIAKMKVYAFEDGDDMGVIELNPTVLAGQFSSTSEIVLSAIEELMEPDEHSQNTDYEGRRLFLLDGERIKLNGRMRFGMPSGVYYRNLRDEETRMRGRVRSQAKWKSGPKGKAYAKKKAASK